MKEYVIVVETGSDITPSQQKEHNFYIVPMHVILGDKVVDDGSFDAQEEFDFYKSTGIIPKSCGSNVDDFEKVYDRIHQERPNAHILYLAYSAVTTVSYKSGMIAAEGRDNITAFDTKQCTAAQSLFAVMVARFLKKNPEAEIPDILNFCEDLVDRIHMGFLPGDMDYLRAGGRVSNAAYIATKLLSIKPLIEVKDGVLTATRKYRGNDKKIYTKALLDMIEKYNYTRDIIYLIHSPRISEELLESLVQVCRDLGFKEIDINVTGGVISSHAGPGAFGVAGISEK